MSLSAAAIRMLANKGLSGADIADVAEANEPVRSSGAVRQKRYRDNKRDVTRDVTRPPNERDNLTPVDVSEADASSHQPRPWSLPAGVSLRVWDDFKKNRSKKRLPNTETAWKGFIDDLSRVAIETGIPPPKLVEQCTAKGWGAIYDPRTDNERRPNTLGRNQPSDGLSPTTRASLRVFGPG